ncbi:MAG: GHKL domain-containing protein [Lachnospiraceae bacterium]|nr:GHKL domain-containing protein [Lachnospiraceae bacterium]
MDYFSLCLEIFCLIGQSVIHIIFSSRLTGKKRKIEDFAIYFFLLCLIEWFFKPFFFSEIFAIGAQLIVLYGMNCLKMGNRSLVSCVIAILTIYITQLSFGIINSVEGMVFPCLIGNPMLYLLLLLATLTAFLISVCCYETVLKVLSLIEGHHTPFIGLLLFPGFFFFATEFYILNTSYHFVPSMLSSVEIGKHMMLLLLQVLGLVAFFCSLYAYRGICQGFQTQAMLDSLTEAARVQKIYVAEAQIRYNQTKGFRHDIKNHLSVLDGLLNSGKWEEGKSYLRKLEKVSDSLTFPCQTGNPVVDILLGEKLGMAKAKGIRTEVFLLLPQFCDVDDFDLCVIFANAMDNAIHACQWLHEEKFIQITGEQQGDFYRLTFENACLDEPLPPVGTGLSNIRTVAEKYHGTMLIEKVENRFSLHVLLDISLHPKSISIQKSCNYF